jgi:hypothetical protein
VSKWLSAVAAIALQVGCTGLPGTAYNPSRYPHPVAMQQYPPQQLAAVPYQVQQQRMHEPTDFQEFRWTNPADSEWCNRPENARWLQTSFNNQIDALQSATVRDPSFWNEGLESLMDAMQGQRIIRIGDITAGESYCATNSPGACAPHPGAHACHVTVWLGDGTSVRGTFSLNDERAPSFISDAMAKANGM